MKRTSFLSKGSNFAFVVFFAATITAPHLFRSRLRELFDDYSSRPTRNWARKPLEEFPALPDKASLLDGKFARSLDDYMKETVFSRYLTAIGNEVLYAGFRTFRKPWVRGSDGWVFWNASLNYVVDDYDRGFAEARLERLATIQELVAICFASREVECVVLPIPKKASVCSEFLPRGRAQRASRSFEDPVWNSILKKFAEHDVEVVNLRPRLRLMIRDGEFPFFKLGTHMSPLGVLESGKMAAERIRELVPSLSQRHGDLAMTVMKTRKHTTDATYNMGFRDSLNFASDFKFALEYRNFPNAKINVPAESEVALTGTSFGSRFGDRMRGKANLARVLAWELSTVVQDHAIHAGGPIKGLLQLIKEAPDLPKLRVVVIEFPFRHCFSGQWQKLGRTLVTIPWCRDAIRNYLKLNPGQAKRFASFVPRK